MMRCQIHLPDSTWYVDWIDCEKDFQREDKKLKSDTQRERCERQNTKGQGRNIVKSIG